MKSQMDPACGFLCKKLCRIFVIICWILFSWILLTSLSPTVLSTVFTSSSQIKTAGITRNRTGIGNFFHAGLKSANQIKETFVSLLDNSVFIYSAIGYKSAPQYNTFDYIYLNGWEDRMWFKFYQPVYTCCLIYDPYDKHIVASRLVEKHNWYYVGKAKLEVKQFVCSNILRAQHKRPVAISLGIDKQCPTNHMQYIRVDYPQSGGLLAVCAKLVYENVSASAMIEWIEYQIIMGVTKILTYTQRLNDAAMSVLDYYQSVGVVEHFPLTLPPIGNTDRYVGVKNFQGWNDEQVPVYDCQGKLSGYDYIGLYDTDEYIYPIMESNLVELLEVLRGYHDRAAGFTFKTEIYATTWGANSVNSSDSDLTIERYTKRTEPFRDRVKSIVITNRMVPGRLSTHGYWSKPTFNKPVVDTEEATLKHYRTCRKEWLKRGGEKCYKTIPQVIDTSMLSIAAKIKVKVDEVKHSLGIR